MRRAGSVPRLVWATNKPANELGDLMTNAELERHVADELSAGRRRAG
jgi:hypothetical protein